MLGAVFLLADNDSHQMLAEIPNLPWNWGVFLLADLLTVTKSANRFNDIHQICQLKWREYFTSRFGHQICQVYWLSQNLSADLLTVTKSAGRFAEFYEICWQKCWGQYFCWQIYWVSPNLLADLLSQNLPADLLTFNKFCHQKWGDISARKYTDCHQIFQQIYWLSLNLLTDVLSFTKSADRNVGEVFLLADLLTVSKSDSRNNPPQKFGVKVDKSASRFGGSQQICQQI